MLLLLDYMMMVEYQGQDSSETFESTLMSPSVTVTSSASCVSVTLILNEHVRLQLALVGQYQVDIFDSGKTTRLGM